MEEERPREFLALQCPNIQITKNPSESICMSSGATGLPVPSGPEPGNTIPKAAASGNCQEFIERGIKPFTHLEMNGPEPKMAQNTPNSLQIEEESQKSEDSSSLPSDSGSDIGEEEIGIEEEFQPLSEELESEEIIHSKPKMAKKTGHISG